MKLKPLFIVTFLMLYCAVSNAQGWRQRVAPRENIPLDSIQLSDPFILADEKTRTYYMTGTGGMLWKSKDLLIVEGMLSRLGVGNDLFADAKSIKKHSPSGFEP